MECQIQENVEYLLVTLSLVLSLDCSVVLPATVVETSSSVDSVPQDSLVEEEDHQEDAETRHVTR